MRIVRPFERIYRVVSQIPEGKVATYKEIAKAALVGNPRIVGFALHANKEPVIIACHRVVKSNGAFARGYAFGGAKKQRAKLREEGVSFLDNEHVDLASCLAKLFPYNAPSKRSTIRQQNVYL